MGQTQRVGKTATHCFVRAVHPALNYVRYHATDVVSWNDDQIILNTGGYRTVTTKARMNQASNQFGLGFGVYQKDHAWHVTYKGKTIAFYGQLFVLDRKDAKKPERLEKFTVSPVFTK